MWHIFLIIPDVASLLFQDIESINNIWSTNCFAFVFKHFLDCFVAFISTPTILLCLEIVSNLLCVVMQICLPRSIAQFVGKFLIPPKSSFCFVESLKFVDMGGSWFSGPLNVYWKLPRGKGRAIWGSLFLILISLKYIRPTIFRKLQKMGMN